MSVASKPKPAEADPSHRIGFTYLSQEDLLTSGCLDFHLAIEAAEDAILAHREGKVFFPEKIVQIFNEDTQERINCLTATSAQAPLLKAAWVKPGAFYSHIGGWEDEYEVAQGCDKIVCDHWDTVKHRTQTLSRMYKDRVLKDEDIYCDIDALVAGEKAGRETDTERIYFNAVGLAFTEVAIAWAMYRRAMENYAGQQLTMQQTTIFEHSNIAQCFRR